MKAIRRRMVEEEVEAPDDLLTLAEAARRYGPDVRVLSVMVARGDLDSYIVQVANPRRGRVRVREADIKALREAIIIGGEDASG